MLGHVTLYTLTSYDMWEVIITTWQNFSQHLIWDQEWCILIMKLTQCLHTRLHTEHDLAEFPQGLRLGSGVYVINEVDTMFTYQAVHRVYMKKSSQNHDLAEFQQILTWEWCIIQCLHTK